MQKGRRGLVPVKAQVSTKISCWTGLNSEIRALTWMKLEAHEEKLSDNKPHGLSSLGAKHGSKS